MAQCVSPAAFQFDRASSPIMPRCVHIKRGETSACRSRHAGWPPRTGRARFLPFLRFCASRIDSRQNNSSTLSKATPFYPDRCRGGPIVQSACSNRGRWSACPLRIISRHCRRTFECPLYPRKQTSPSVVGTSAKCQQRTIAKTQASYGLDCIAACIHFARSCSNAVPRPGSAPRPISLRGTIQRPPTTRPGCR
jgi:hypothetical protein